MLETQHADTRSRPCIALDRGALALIDARWENIEQSAANGDAEAARAVEQWADWTDVEPDFLAELERGGDEVERDPSKRDSLGSATGRTEAEAQMSRAVFFSRRASRDWQKVTGELTAVDPGSAKRHAADLEAVLQAVTQFPHGLPEVDRRTRKAVLKGWSLGVFCRPARHRLTNPALILAVIPQSSGVALASMNALRTLLDRP